MERPNSETPVPQENRVQVDPGRVVACLERKLAGALLESVQWEALALQQREGLALMAAELKALKGVDTEAMEVVRDETLK